MPPHSFHRRELKRQRQQRLLSAVGDLYLNRNLVQQIVALTTLLTEVLSIYRADGCDRVRIYVKRLDDEHKED